MKSTPSLPLRPEQTVSSARSSADSVAAAGPFWSLSFVCALASIFILYSRFFDLAANGLRIPRIVLSLMIVFFLLSGRALVFLRSTTGKLMLLFLFWNSFTLIFSVWKTGSLPPYYQLVQSTLFFAVAAGLPIIVANVRRITSALAFSGLVAALLSVPWGTDQLGRLALREGSYLDPNYYAMALVVTVPFFWEMAASAKSFVGKIFAWVCLVPVVGVLARTGSRGAMLAFAVMLLLLFLMSPIKTKMLLLATSALGLVALLAVMPDYIRTRYLTFFEVNSTQVEAPNSGNSEASELDRLRADASSAEGRKRLLLTSISLTLEHPLVGVGPGNFPTAVYDESKASGRARNEWLVTHNSYTEISSETGFPGFLLFIFLLGSSFKNLASVIKRAKPAGETPDPAAYNSAKYLLLSMAALSVCIFFLAVGYEFTIYLLAGLTVSLRRGYEQELVAGAEAAAEGEAEAVVEAARAVPAKPAVEPAYAKIQTALPTRARPVVAGRPVRFNRFR